MTTMSVNDQRQIRQNLGHKSILFHDFRHKIYHLRQCVAYTNGNHDNININLFNLVFICASSHF
jgi:hypothetical protein